MTPEETKTAPRAQADNGGAPAPRPQTKPAAAPAVLALSVKNLSVFFGKNQVLKSVSLNIEARAVTAIIGPSGCGKSTFLRSLNRMHELVPTSRVEGDIRLFGEDIYSKGVEPVIVRRRVGMVFQKSNPFPTMSIGENVVVGLTRAFNVTVSRQDLSLNAIQLQAITPEASPFCNIFPSGPTHLKFTNPREK